MIEFSQHNAVYIFVWLIIGWFLWQRLIAPKLAGVKSMSAGAYLEFRQAPHTLLDVRQLGEWNSGHAADAIHIPLAAVRSRMSEIPRDRAVVVICASGNRSAMAALTLAKSGFEEVYNFSGGMGSWGKTGLPVK